MRLGPFWIVLMRDLVGFVYLEVDGVLMSESVVDLMADVNWS